MAIRRGLIFGATSFRTWVPFGRCLAPDYVGMGYSGAAADGKYRFFDQQRYLDAWFDALAITRNVILVVHDWGSALGFSWAQRHPNAIKAIVYMEGIVRPFRSWDEWPDATRVFFQRQRTAEGEELILEKNLFIEYVLPLRNIPGAAMDVYRRYFAIPGSARMPMLAWTRDLPIAGEPAGFLIGAQREFCRAWPNQQIVTVAGAHFLQEDAPAEVADAIARFTGKVLAGQIS